MTRLLFLLILPCLAACLATPRRSFQEEPVDPPPAFVGQGLRAGTEPGEPDARPWWERLGDAALAAAVEEAFEHNRDLAVAAARVDAARAEARAMGAGRAPTAQLAADAARRRQNFIGLPVPGGGDVLSSTSTSTSLGLSLDVAWEADLWGRLSARDRAAGADARASEDDLAAARLSLAGQVARAWFALAEARLQVALGRRTADSYGDHVEVLRERHAVGRAEALELHLFEHQLATARALVEQRGEQEARARFRLELLLGRVPSGTQLGASELPAPVEPVPAGLPADLAWRRPDLVAARHRLEALDWRLAAARADLLPALRLTASAGRRSSELSDLVDSAFDVWSLAANLVQPLFEGGRLRARADLAEARARGALEELAQAFLAALGEVETALAAEEHLARRGEHLERAAREAAAAREVAEERYFAGLVDVLFLLDAQRRDLLGQSELLELRRRRLENRIDLFLALGGGFGPQDAPLLARAERAAPAAPPPLPPARQPGDSDR